MVIVDLQGLNLLRYRAYLIAERADWQKVFRQSSDKRKEQVKYSLMAMNYVIRKFDHYFPEIKKHTYPSIPTHPLTSTGE